MCSSFEEAINNLDKEPIFIVVSTKKGDEVKTSLFTEGLSFIEEFTILNMLFDNFTKKTLKSLENGK